MRLTNVQSISLTQLPVAVKSKQITKDNKVEPPTAVEYSSREVKPAALLLQDLLRAHATFLLHHASSMSALFVRTRRSKFIGILGRYWDSYTAVWNVLLHGNPAVNIYGGIKLAASGELGVGVGEEDRGSGEREVLEGFVARTEGLIDLVVSRFGEAKPDEEAEKDAQSTARAGMLPQQPWLGTGAEPAGDDGAIFLGVGALSRKSLRDVTYWMEDLYSWGSQAYGVQTNPSSNRRSRGKRRAVPMAALSPRAIEFQTPSEIPRTSPDIQAAGGPTSPGQLAAIQEGGTSRDAAATKARPARSKDGRPKIRRDKSSVSVDSNKSKDSVRSKGSKTSNQETSENKTGKFVSFLKMGYGTHWSLGGSSASEDAASNEVLDQDALSSIPTKVTDLVPQDVETGKNSAVDIMVEEIQKEVNDSDGHFLVGLLGDLESEEDDEDRDDSVLAGLASDEEGDKRILLRTVTVELERAQDARPEANISIDFGNDDRRAVSSHQGSSHLSEQTNQSGGSVSYEIQDRNKTKKLRIIVYVKRPFVYAFFFELRTASLAFPTLYKSFHHQLGPLQRPLLTSTQRAMSRPEMSSTNGEAISTPVYDLLWDPKQLTLTSTIPNIPEPIPRSPDDHGWSRIEALSTHLQVLNTYSNTRKDRLELEKTCKTSRGWWIVWTRILEQEIEATTPLDSRASEASSDYGPLSRISTIIREESGDTAKAGTTSSSFMQSLQPSTVSGPAHPYLESQLRREWVPKDKEIFLIRKSGDNAGKSAGMMGTGASYIGMGDGWGSAPVRLAQGIGIDTKRYIEGLLNMTGS